MISGLNEWLGNMNMFDMGQEGEQDISRQYQKSQSSRFHYASSQNQDITLMTEEGDRISIHKSRETSIDYMSFDYTKELKNKITTIHEEKGNVFQSGSFEISVEGNLSEEEMADIREILKGLDQVMADLKDGNLESVLKNSIKLLEDKETLSSLNAVLQFSREIEIEERQMIKTQNIPLDPQPLKGQAINLLDFIERVTEKTMKYLEKTEVVPIDFKDIINQIFSELHTPIALETE